MTMTGTHPRWKHVCFNDPDGQPCCVFIGWIYDYDIYAQKAVVVLRNKDQQELEPHLGSSQFKGCHTVPWVKIAPQHDVKAQRVVNHAKAVRAMLWGLS